MDNTFTFVLLRFGNDYSLTNYHVTKHTQVAIHQSALNGEHIEYPKSLNIL